MDITARPIAFRHIRLTGVIPSRRVGMIALALGMALIWWLVAARLHADGRLLVWDDLRSTFSHPSVYLEHPYDAAGYFAAPWANLLLLPFEPLALSARALAMTAVYFTLIAVLVSTFGGDWRALVIVLTSALALDTALEINIDWIVCLGLLVPRRYSLPLLLVKPQIAWGYALAYDQRTLVRAVIVGLLVLLASLLIWGAWFVDLAHSLNYWQVNALVNVAPLNLATNISPTAGLLVIGAGVALGIHGMRRRDGRVTLFAGLCLVPYVAPTSLLIPLALLAVRHHRSAALLSAILWALVFSVALPFF